MPLTSWTTYLNRPPSEALVRKHWSQYATAFREQYRNIATLFDRLRPKTVTCLGAGTMADLPVETFLADAQQLTLVEWAPGLTKEAYRLKNAEWRAKGVSYPIEPRLIDADITMGRASQFVDQVPALVASHPDAVECCRRACQAVGSTSRDVLLPITDNSTELAVSSMVVSQFWVDPYGFFERNLREQFALGAELPSAALRDALQQLRMLLYQSQVEAHVRELHRIVSKPHGVVYFSMEVLGAKKGSGHFDYFVPANIAINTISRYFHFDIECLGTERIATRAELSYGDRIVFGYVLRPLA